MKARDTDRLSLLSMLVSEIKNAGIEMKKRDGLSDEEVEAVLRKAGKRRQEAAAQYDEGGRADLAEKERGELAIIEGYLPKQMGEDEIRGELEAIISGMGADSPKQLGMVMKEAMPKFAGRADGGLVRKLAQEILGG